jgi:hypothetical protein
MSNSTNVVGSGKAWANEILEWYGTGDFDVEVAAKLEVPLKEFYKQMQDNAAFGRLVEYGRTLCEAYWVSQAKRNLNNKTFNSSAWAFVMKNKFNWADKTEQSTAEINPNMNADELRQKLLKDATDFVRQHMPELENSREFLRLVTDNGKV